MVAKNLAVYEPAKQTRSVLLYWRLPEEWAEVLHEWVRPNDQAPEFSGSLARAVHANYLVLLPRRPQLVSSILS